MITKTYQIVPRTLLVICVVLLIIGTSGPARSQPNPHGDTSLFEEVPLGDRHMLDELARAFHESSKAAKENYKSTVVRSDYIRLNWDEMIVVASEVKPTLLRLFKDLAVEFVPKRFEKISLNPKMLGKKERFRWSGGVRVNGREIGQVIFVANQTDRTFSGTIRYQNKVFRIRPLGDDRYEVTELKVEGFPEEASPLKQDRSQSAPAPPPPNPDRTIRHDVEVGVPTPGGLDEPTPAPGPEATSAPCVIDVMILYTRDAWAATPDIEGEIFEAIIQANETFEYSKVNAVVQPVFWDLLAFPEGEFASIEKALDEIRNDSTIWGAQVDKLRREWKADLVSLWVENSGRGQDYCGIGYQSDPHQPSDTFAFTVVRRDCASGQLSFTHEIGHNLGMGHDRYDGAKKGENDGMSNYGHVSLPNAQRTMMATNRECWDNSMIVCERLPFFSSPNFTYPGSVSGEPMGIPPGEPDAADNAAVTRWTACQIANFR